jgi:hypothetical protein
MQAYAGRVRGDVDHEALKPAAWRVDGYLEGVEEEDLSMDALRGHHLAFAKAPDARDKMARRDDGDDLLVRVAGAALGAVMGVVFGKDRVCASPLPLPLTEGFARHCVCMRTAALLEALHMCAVSAPCNGAACGAARLTLTAFSVVARLRRQHSMRMLGPQMGACHGSHGLGVRVWTWAPGMPERRGAQVVDPLLEKGKAKWNKAQAKLKKRQTEWAGRARAQG